MSLSVEISALDGAELYEGIGGFPQQWVKVPTPQYATEGQKRMFSDGDPPGYCPVSVEVGRKMVIVDGQPLIDAYIMRSIIYRLLGAPPPDPEDARVTYEDEAAEVY